MVEKYIIKLLDGETNELYDVTLNAVSFVSNQHGLVFVDNQDNVYFFSKNTWVRVEKFRNAGITLKEDRILRINNETMQVYSVDLTAMQNTLTVTTNSKIIYFNLKTIDFYTVKQA